MRKFELSSMTWPEVEEALRKSEIAIIPVGALEEHGPHIPIDSDNIQAIKIIGMAVQKISNEVPVVVAPLIPFGLSQRYMGFPGTITLGPETLMKIIIDVGKSLIHHGFKRIVILTTHTRNLPALESAGRILADETDAFISVSSIWSIAISKGLFNVRKSKPGGIGHACELETSMNLALRPEEVNMNLAQDEVPDFFKKEWYYMDNDLKLGPKVRAFWDLKSLGGKSGIIGHATEGSKEAGEKALQICVDVVADYLRSLRNIKV